MELDGRPYWFALVPNDARPLTDYFGAGELVVPAGSVLDIRCAAFVSPDVLRDLGNVVSATIVIRQDHARGPLLHTSTVAAEAFDDTLTLDEWRARGGEHFRFLISGEETNWAIRAKWRGVLWIEIGLDTDEGKASVRTGKGLCQASGLDTAGESGVTADVYRNAAQSDARFVKMSQTDGVGGPPLLVDSENGPVIPAEFLNIGESNIFDGGWFP